MTALPRPYVQPSGHGPVRRWIARCDCGCGLFEEHTQQADADAAVREATAAHDEPPTENGADR